MADNIGRTPIATNPDKEEDEISVHSSESSAQGQQYMSMTEKGDIEAYPDEINEPQNTDYDQERVVTRTSTKSSWNPGPPPDGGAKAWTQAAMGHLVIMNTWGFINSFGVFQAYYVTALNRPPSDISWVGSIQVFLLFFIGTFTGRLTDAGYFRHIFLFGSILQVIGIFMTSLSTQYWQLFLAQGVCTGIGNGCLFCPSLSIISTYFSKKRSLAIGICAAGSATGGLIFPAMVQQLLPKIGFGWTIRSVAFIQFACLAVANVFVRPRLPPRKTGPLMELAAFKELPYLLFSIGMFFNFWGVYFAFYYISSFGRSIIGVSYTESINLLLVLNGVGVIGRVIPNHLADRYAGPLNLLIPSVLGSSLLLYCWIAVSSRGRLYAWSVMFGIFGAAVQGLFPATLSSLSTDLRKAGTRMGQVFTIVSFAVLTGPPIGGTLLQAHGGGYLYAQLFTGTSMLIGCCLMIATRLAKTGATLKIKV